MGAPFRLARATAFSAVCVSLTLVAHWLAAGDPLSFRAVATAFCGVGAIAYLVAGAERSLPVIIGLLLGGQFSLHAFLASAGGHHGAIEVGETLSPGMSAAHLLAGLLSALWLRRGERAAWAMARRLLTPLLVRAGAVRLPAPLLVLPAAPEAPVRPVAALLRHALVLRGPPVRSPAP
ncbi:MFS transporter [Actinocorallia longicatena]|uniref:MFS transporter n=1 Tax=Actinocorallia longicatena TaxID=111803 RepID=A0ABP6QP02_9ACTN